MSSDQFNPSKNTVDRERLDSLRQKLIQGLGQNGPKYADFIVQLREKYMAADGAGFITFSPLETMKSIEDNGDLGYSTPYGYLRGTEILPASEQGRLWKVYTLFMELARIILLEKGIWEVDAKSADPTRFTPGRTVTFLYLQALGKSVPIMDQAQRSLDTNTLSDQRVLRNSGNVEWLIFLSER